MPILVSDIISRVAAQIDAEGSEYYLPTQDYLPAVRSAQDFIVGVINSQLGKKKFSEEIFKDLTYAQVWQANNFSRIAIDPATSSATAHFIWSVIDVIPLPTTFPPFVFTPVAQPYLSLARPDLAHVESEFYATRMATEEWEKNKGNPFAQGHSLETNEVATQYAYLLQTNYTAAGYQATITGQPQEIEIRPSVANLPVTIKYIKVPSVPAAVTDFVEFPGFVMEILVAATANFISYKQADGTTLEGLSSKLLAMLFTENA